MQNGHNIIFTHFYNTRVPQKYLKNTGYKYVFELDWIKLDLIPYPNIYAHPKFEVQT